MDLTKVLFGEDSDNEKYGTHSSSSSSSAADSFSGSANSGGGSGSGGDDDEKNGEVADGSNTADSHQHDRDLFASDNGDYSKTLAQSSHPIPVGGDCVIKKDLEDTFKIHEEIEQEKVTKGQVTQEVDDHYFKAMAMAMDETRDEILEQQNQLSDFSTREEERLVSEYSEFEKQIKLLEAEVARKKLERELSSKNLELLKATAVSHALHLHSLKIKIQASDERMAQLESKFQDLKANYEKLRKSPPF